jgi:hypothetical protein
MLINITFNPTIGLKKFFKGHVFYRIKMLGQLDYNLWTSYLAKKYFSIRTI